MEKKYMIDGRVLEQVEKDLFTIKEKARASSRTIYDSADNKEMFEALQAVDSIKDMAEFLLDVLRTQTTGIKGE